MADLTPGEDRGQLILVLGLALAVAIVALVLLLNTVIYTQNLATRDTGTGGADAVEYRSAAVDGVGGLVDRENARPYDDRGALEANVSAGVEGLDAMLARRYVDYGVTAHLTDVALGAGALVEQTNASRTLTADGTRRANWTVAENVSRLRAFHLRATPTATDPSTATAVRLQGTDGGSWRLFLYENDSTAELAVATNGSAPARVCPDLPTGETVTVNLTAGTVAGEPCSGLSYAAGLTDPYRVAFVHGDRATGTYALTVDTEGGGQVATGNLSSTPTASGPYHAPAVYEVRARLFYETPSLRYVTQVRVAPGEPA